MISLQQLLSLLIVCIVLFQDGETKDAEDYFHIPPSSVMQDKIKYPGWQEPGLWRPKWFLYRTIIDEKDETKTKTERLCIKLNTDRTLLVFRPQYRKWIDWRDPKAITEEVKLNDNPSTPKRPEDIVTSRDGTWWWQDNKDGTGSIKLEIKEKVPKKIKVIVNEETKEVIEEEEDLGFGNLYRYETNVGFGRILDPYSFYFEDGIVTKYKDAEKKGGLPVGSKQIGFFSIRANIQRPLISKEFLAFQ